MNAIRRSSLVLVLSLAATLLPRQAARAYDVVLNAQGEYLDAYLIDGSPVPRRVVFIDPDPPEPDNPAGPPARVGRHVNGKLCFFPKGYGHDGYFVIADDTYREACLDRSTPQARCAITNPRKRGYVGRDADGWGVFRRNGKWAKWVIQTDSPAPGSETQGNIDPQGCAFDAHGNFWGNDVGHGRPGAADGSLVVFFPGPQNRYDTYCFLDKALASAGMPFIDGDGNVLVPEPGGARVSKFAPPFPQSAADCANPEHLVTTPPTKSAFLTSASGIATPINIVQVPRSDHLYIGSVVIPALIDEFDRTGMLVRHIVPAGVPRNPIGMGVGSDGTIYYAELNLDPATFRTRCGRVSRARFDAMGQPLPPELLGSPLRFPDGVTVVDSRQLKVRWDKLPPGLVIDPTRCGGE